MIKPQFQGRPFRTKDFSQRGAGLDFLGLRWVNLEIVGRYLLPEINNATRDLGTFALGAWIAWKFRRLCQKQTDCTEENYQAFNERVQIALALQAQSPIAERVQRLGTIRNALGKMQKVKLPGVLRFKDVNRTENTSLFAPVAYGPALQMLGLIQSYKLHGTGGRLAIPTVSPDDGTKKVVEAVDQSLRRSSSYARLATLKNQSLGQDDIVSLGKAGLHPGYWRQKGQSVVKDAFRPRLLPSKPGMPGYCRTLTALLILETLRKSKAIGTDEMRSVWYTGMFSNGAAWQSTKREIQTQRLYWAHFMARQYQKYALETFLFCLEEGLQKERRTIADIIDYHLKAKPAKDLNWPDTFDELLRTEARAITKRSASDLIVSQMWNERVHAGHVHFEEADDDEEVASLFYASRLVARWFWRIAYRIHSSQHDTLLDLGGVDRISMKSFLNWLEARRKASFRDFLTDLFSDLVFSQHMRVALSRFDNKAQRLRFMLGDNGIEPTAGVLDIGDRDVPWMPDRLDSFCELLVDVDILTIDTDYRFSVGPKAGTLKNV